jgi:hypothetical protein
MVENLVKKIISVGGKIKPLIIPHELSQGCGLMNPSLFIEEEKILINLRNVNYAIVHSENEQRFHSRWGPLTYAHPENDNYLRTTNFYVEINKNLEITRLNKVDTTNLDKPPIWDFVGLEDARIVKWEGKYYLCGVRRDTKKNGEGRMELSEITINNNEVIEVSRSRIEPPNDPNSYCEKNWMPVLDSPFCFVKWSNPTEVVEVDLLTNKSKTIFLGENIYPLPRDIRGGSSIINFGNHRIALTHEVQLFNSDNGQKDGIYYHRFVVWDKDWNIIKWSDDFNFMGARIEFCCGLGILEDKVLMTFGFQDNAAYVVEAPLNFLEEFIYG